MKSNNIIKSLISTFVILISIAMISVPTSHSKYVKFDDSAAIYDTDFYDLYKDAEEVGAVLELLQSSTPEIAYFKVYFPTNTEVATGAKIDKYFLELIPNSCTIENWSSVSYKPSVDYVNKQPWVVSELLSCNVRPQVDEETGEVLKQGLLQEDGTTIKLVVNVKEQINEEAKFLYLSLSYEDTLSNYLGETEDDKTTIKIDKTDEDGNEKTKTQIYEELREKLMAYAKTRPQESIVRTEHYIDNYIFEKVVTKENITNFYLPGLSIEHDEENDVYVYKINPSIFDDHVATYSEINYDGHDILSFNFVNDYTGADKDKFIDDTFEYYINNFSKYSDSEKELILDYVRNAGPFSKVVSGEIERIKGINYTDNKALLTANLIRYATPVSADNKFTIALNSTGYMQNELRDYLENKYSDVFSKTLADYIYNDYSKDNLYDVIKINNKASKEIIDFTKYVTYFDTENSNYVIFKVYYNAAENGNTVEFITYKITDDTKISFVNNDNTLEITISNTDQERLDDTIKYLDDYFGSVTDVTDPVGSDTVKVTFSEDSETGIITATYIIEKTLVN